MNQIIAASEHYKVHSFLQQNSHVFVMLYNIQHNTDLPVFSTPIVIHRDACVGMSVLDREKDDILRSWAAGEEPDLSQPIHIRSLYFERCEIAPNVTYGMVLDEKSLTLHISRWQS